MSDITDTVETQIESTTDNIENEKPKKRVRGKASKKFTRKVKTKKGPRREAWFESIINRSTSDLSYIMANESLFKEHKSYIKTAADSQGTSPVEKLTVKTGKLAGQHPKGFYQFSKNYFTLFLWWRHIMRCCFDESYQYYQFFGAKGISVDKTFLNAKKFCMWALKNGLTREPFMYDIYLQRKDKTKDFSVDNCYVITEKAVHECKDVKLVLNSLFLIKEYESKHDPSVSYMTFYTRYYMYDMSVDDACTYKFDPTKTETTIGFSPFRFYHSVADEHSCVWSTFKSRMHYSYLNGGFNVRPYDLLKPDFSVSEEANRQGKLSYKQQYLREKKKEKDSLNIYNNKSNSVHSDSLDESNNVYSNGTDVYSD